MSVIFQLFRTSDLANLTPAQLEELKRAVGLALNEQHVLQHIKGRADEVFEQLTGNIPTKKTPSPRTVTLSAQALEGVRMAELSNARLSQLYDEKADLDQLDAKKRDILRMAIDCELVHSDHVLQAVKPIAYQKFSDYRGGDLPKGHDRPYSRTVSGEDNYVHIPPELP